jgi:hypothetical protein
VTLLNGFPLAVAGQAIRTACRDKNEAIKAVVK